MPTQCNTKPPEFEPHHRLSVLVVTDLLSRDVSLENVQPRAACLSFEGVVIGNRQTWVCSYLQYGS